MRVMLALLFLLCAYSAPVPGGADDLPTAKEIRDRAGAARGPVPANYRETIVGTGAVGDLRETTFHLGDDERKTFDHGGLHSESGTYHGERWEQDPNGLTVVAVKDPDTSIKDPIKTTVTHVTVPLDAYVISELNARNAGKRTFYDAATFHIVRIERVGPNGTSVEAFHDFAKFGDRTLPARWTVTAKTPAAESEYERAEYATGAATDADIHEPPIRRTLVEFPPGDDSVDLPVTRIRNALFVRVSIGARTVDFALDTGASGIVLDPAFAKELGLQLVNPNPDTAAGGFVGFEAIVPKLRVGSLRMHDIVVDVAPMPNWGTDVKLLGLLGFDFLAQLGVTIDYQHGRIHVTPAERYTPPAGPSVYAFDVRLGDGVPTTTMTMTNAVADRMMFDTGCSCSIAFFDYFARRYPRSFQTDLGSATGSGVGGRMREEWFRFHDIHLGPIRFDNVLGMRFPPSSYLYKADGLIGSDLLSLFTVDLDYTNGRVYLTPNATARHVQELR